MDDTEAMQIAFVDLGASSAPRGGMEYPLLDATDPEMEKRRVGLQSRPSHDGFLVTIQVLSLWTQNMRDWGHRNEGLLKLSGNTRDRADPSQRVEIATTIDFRGRDERLAPITFQMGFSELLIKEQLTLGLHLTELDKDASAYYATLKSSIEPTAGKAVMDLARINIPYLELATKLADGLISTFGKNSNDTTFRYEASVAVHPQSGGPYLRSGIYAFYPDGANVLPPSRLFYRDRGLFHQGSNLPLGKNFLILSVGIKAPAPKVMATLQAM
jgi:hypothetical protein